MQGKALPACADKPLDWFFPAVPSPTMWDAARKVCLSCTVVAECAAYVTSLPYGQGMWGFWAGTSPSERAEMLRRPLNPACRDCGMPFERKPRTNTLLCPACAYEAKLRSNRDRKRETRLSRVGERRVS